MRMKLLLIGAVVVGVLGLFALQLFGPNSGGTLGPQTTYITAPLAADGLPNYALAILELQRAGVTQDNNGARLFWQAMGPGAMSAKHYDLLCQELAIPPGDPSSHLVSPYDRTVRSRVQQWLLEQQAGGDPRSLDDATDAAGGLPGAIPDIATAAEAVIDLTLDMPWTAEDCPPMAEWIAENSKPLDLLVSAAAKAKFYSPSPEVLEDPTTLAIATFPLAIQPARIALRALNVRAYHSMGNKQYADAWRDIHAEWQLGSHLGKGLTIIEKLVGIAIRGVAGDDTLVLLQSEDLPESVAQQILSDLSTMPPAVLMADAVDVAERYMYLDATLRLLMGRFGTPRAVGLTDIDEIAGVFSYNIDEPLRMGNQWYDRFASAARLRDVQARKQALEQIETDLENRMASRGSRMFRSLFSRGQRSSFIGDMYVAALTPALGAAIGMDDRDQMTFALTQIAAALAVHRARHGAYPEALDELVPGLLPTIPPDIYGSGPPIYHRRGDGYVLYSVFENGVDDGGRNYAGDIDAGEWLPEDRRLDVDHDHSDLVIRMPRPRHNFQAEVASGGPADAADEPEPDDVIQSE